LSRASNRRRLIVVSNRGPVTYGRDADGNRVARRGAGGLVTALRGLLERHEVTWIASATTEEDRLVAAEGAGAVTMVAHDPRTYDLYYNVVANPMLWFIQHSLWGPAMSPVIDRAFHDAWHEGYETANRAFADAVVAQLDNTPDADVFFHDYHLYLAPRMVRERRPDARLAHFVHIPWPDDWTILPIEMRRAVHEGLLANDVVAFHTERWAHNFMRSCVDVCGGCGSTHVTNHAISIDVAEFDLLRQRADVLAAEEELERPEKLVVRVDRADPSKNIARGFRAFGVLLDEHPEWRGRVKLLARLDPSRERIPEYVAYREAIEAEAEAVQARHPGSVEVQLTDAFAQSVAAYKQYDVLFVNSVYDGMNLVAKEGPLVNERDGVLVLSENAGAHEELGEWAVTINPFDVWGQAEALHEALSMQEDERRRRAEAIRAQVREYDVARWVDGLLADLDRVAA
jgi:trehalose 6-phosphate synthase